MVASYQTPESRRKVAITMEKKIRGVGTAENDLVRKQIEKKLGSLVKNWDHLRFTIHGNPAVKQQREDDRDSGSQRFSQALIFTCQRCGDEASLIFGSLSSLPSICKHCTASINSMGRAICFRSQPEKDLESFINSMGFTAEVSNREVIKPHEADLYIPEKKLAIEYNGLYWHSDEFQEDNYHLQKTVKANKCGIRLIQIFEDEWIEKRSVVEHRLRHILGKAVQRVGARECEVVKVDKEQGNQFFESYHIQGTTICQDIYGLKHGEQIVACMSFGRRFTLAEEIEDDTEELIRFATACHVPGAASKLLKAWVGDHPGVSLLSFADRRWSNGVVYESLGFKQIRETRPAYWYVHSQKRLNRMGFSKARLVAMGYDPKMTEKEIMEERGYLCVYDAGSLVYRLDPQTT
jgi:G:T-mismatch repair DNA endonuclease (very short patch repair protein)